jgi:hypothetical protein
MGRAAVKKALPPRFVVADSSCRRHSGGIGGPRDVILFMVIYVWSARMNLAHRAISIDPVGALRYE